MSKLSVLITARFDPKAADLFAHRAGVDFQDWSKRERRGYTVDDLAPILKGKRIFVTEIDRVNDDLLARCPDLRVVISCRGSPVNVDIPACTKHGVLVLNTPGRNAEGVADLAVGGMIVMARRVIPAANLTKQGGWATNQGSVYFGFQGSDLSDASIGLVGLGAVAKAVARRLRGFGARILACDPYAPDETFKQLGVIRADLATVVKEADFLSIHVHVTPETKGMIGKAQFAMMKPSAFLINTARSGAVDTEAMVEALRTKRIAGAFLDVFDKEPVAADNPLCALDSVVMTPHIGGSTPGQTREQSRIVADQIIAILDGKQPPHMVNPEVAEKALKGLA